MVGGSGFDPTIGVLDPTTPADSVPAADRRTELRRGATMGGERYEIIRLLGNGGMGAVYAALDHKLDRQVALKLLHSTHDDAPERLIAEAQALARLSDPHVVAIYDAGELDEQVFIVMQLVDGEDMASALARRRPSIQQIIAWFSDAGRGLAAAHAAGLVHRDFKPSNVLIDRRSKAAVTDFGLARSVTAERGVTGVGAMMGTPAYMSPEQHGMEAATQASDQFSFCVALWESLLGQHPFVVGDRGAMSPFAIGYQIYDGKLIPPPRGKRVPRRLVEVLTRGLERDPAKRWPSMDALLAELAPTVKRRVWPVVSAAAIVAAAAGGAAMWFVLGQPGDDRHTCLAAATSRASAAWSPAAAEQLRDRFTKTGRSYAATAARQASGALDRYASRWSQLAADVCTAERATTGAMPELLVRRRACLDSRLDSLRGVAGLLTIETKPDFVDRAQPIVDGLPELGDCNDSRSLLASPGSPPPAKADEVAKLELELGRATARSRGGDYHQAVDDLIGIVKRADTLDWAPLSARAYSALGEAELALTTPGARERLMKAGELATASGLDREAALAWALALRAAGGDNQPDAVAVLAPLARATAAHSGDRVLQVQAEIAQGRALVRIRKLKDALELCRSALAAAQALDNSNLIDHARDCLIEALVPLGADAEVDKLIVQMIADNTRILGADHPTIADYLQIRVSMEVRHGKLVEARTDAARIMEIRKRAFPPHHIKTAESLMNLAEVADAENKPQESKKLYEEALAIAASLTPEPLGMISNLHIALGYAAQAEDDHAGAVKHFEDAIELTRKRVGGDSLELAFLLVNYGQIKASDNLEAGLGILGEARAILEKHKDKRAYMVAGAMANIEAFHLKWAEARTHAEEILAHADADTAPHQLALTSFLLARALVETKGDVKRARKLASEARAIYAKLGPSFTKNVKTIDTWLAKH